MRDVPGWLKLVAGVGTGALLAGPRSSRRRRRRSSCACSPWARRHRRRRSPCVSCVGKLEPADGIGRRPDPRDRRPTCPAELATPDRRAARHPAPRLPAAPSPCTSAARRDPASAVATPPAVVAQPERRRGDPRRAARRNAYAGPDGQPAGPADPQIIRQRRCRPLDRGDRTAGDHDGGRLTPTDAAAMVRAVVDEVGKADRRQAAGDRADHGRPARRRPRPARRRPRRGQDAHRPLDRRRRRAVVLPRPVHARPAPGRHHRLDRARPGHPRIAVPPRARSSPRSSSPTRSTGPRPRPRRRCSRRCRSARPPPTASPTPCRRPFLVIATQNPIESEGTYPLPEAQLDRFILRTTIGLPGAGGRGRDRPPPPRPGHRRGRSSTPCSTPASSALVQQSIERVEVDEVITGYVVDLIRATRAARELAVGSSPRGSLAVVKLARARAVIAGRDFVTPDDVKEVAVAALGHRVVLTPECVGAAGRPGGGRRPGDPLGPGADVALIKPRRDRRPLGYATLAIGFTAFALLRGEPRDLALAAPFAAVLIVGLRSVQAIEVVGRIDYDTVTAIEGDEVTGTIDARPSPRPDHDDRGRQPCRLVGDRPRTGADLDRRAGGRPHPRPVHACAPRRGGATASARSTCRCADRSGSPCGSTSATSRRRSTCCRHPSTCAACSRRRPRSPRPGVHISRFVADGFDFAELRPFAIGDRLRDVNWRASARSDELQTNRRHPDRSGEVVLLLDTFADGIGTASLAAQAALTRAARAAWSVAQLHLGVQDRVGLAAQGRVVTQLRPRSGDRARYDLLGTLLSIGGLVAAGESAHSRQPLSRLPPNALILAFTPLIDQRFNADLLALHRAGRPVMAVQIVLDDLYPPPADAPTCSPGGSSPSASTAARGPGPRRRAARPVDRRRRPRRDRRRPRTASTARSGWRIMIPARRSSGRRWRCSPAWPRYGRAGRPRRLDARRRAGGRVPRRHDRCCAPRRATSTRRSSSAGWSRSSPSARARRAFAVVRRRVRRRRDRRARPSPRRGSRRAGRPGGETSPPPSASGSAPAAVVVAASHGAGQRPASPTSPSSSDPARPRDARGEAPAPRRGGRAARPRPTGRRAAPGAAR